MEFGEKESDLISQSGLFSLVVLRGYFFRKLSYRIRVEMFMHWDTDQRVTSQVTDEIIDQIMDYPKELCFFQLHKNFWGIYEYFLVSMNMYDGKEKKKKCMKYSRIPNILWRNTCPKFLMTYRNPSNYNREIYVSGISIL